jgi:Abnormal spindle-like microcephaly-assoc'd, ASPM-SPD-2-Hydin
VRLPRSKTRRLPATIFLFFALTLLTLLPIKMRAAVHELSISPARLRYGKVEAGLTRTIHVTLTNNGHASVKISGIRSSNRKFELSKLKLPKILAAGARLRVSVIFAPTSEGWENGHITVISDASDRTLTVEAAGTGVIGEVIASPASLSFGKVGVGESSKLPLVLINTHPWRVTLKSVHITGRAFSVSGATFPLTLAAGQRVRLNAAFKPEVDGLTDGSLSISGPALHVPLTGTGTSASRPHLTMIPGTLSFGNVSVGTTETLTLGLRASGGSVTISSLSFSSSGSQFAVPGVAFPLTIRAGEESSLNVTFTPQNDGNKSAKLSLASNAANSPASEPLTGTGTAPYVTLSWIASTSEVTGYNVYRGTSRTGRYNKINASLDPDTTYRDATIVSGSTYFYATTAVNSSGEESAYSNRVEVVVP